MAVNSGNIDVIIEHDVENIPLCNHGPTLLFSRYDRKSGSERRFFACSAFRDRKACPFFRWADDVKNVDKDKWVHHSDGLKHTFSHEEMRKRLTQIKKLDESERSLCIDCGLLLLPGEQKSHNGQGHTLRSNISKELLGKPSQLFKPLEDNKTFAQYLFSHSTVDFVIDTLVSLDITHVLCIGCPRIHEAVKQKYQDETATGLRSLLLDLDHRYLQLFPPSEFCLYNMMNHHFFGGESDQDTYSDLIREKDGQKVAMVIDPPFGVMVDALTATINKIQDEWRQAKGIDGTHSDQMPVFWFFPYFMEQRVVTPTSGYTMLDYKVDYDNHDLFRGEKGRKKGSPVRIFTNLSPGLITLPASQGYWYCDQCKAYRSKENKHCFRCETCPTKDGNTYIHCQKCNRCVKPSRVHCDKCNICDLPQHNCGQSVSKGCHICGDLDHKRRDCPKKLSQTENNTSGSAKRKGSNGQSLRKKKKRK